MLVIKLLMCKDQTADGVFSNQTIIECYIVMKAFYNKFRIHVLYSSFSHLPRWFGKFRSLIICM